MSKHVQINETAADFSLTDVHGREIRLADYRETSNVLLVFNRGFV
jgi:peroxiredoxin